MNRKKANRLLGPAGVQFSLGPKANGFFDSSIKTEVDLVKLKNENPTLYQTAGYNQEKNRCVKGYIMPDSDGRRVITLLEEANESTCLHEMSHMFLMDLEDLAQIDKVSKKEVSPACAGTIPRSEESVLQGNVLYVNTEKVPNFEKTLISLQWLEGLPKLETSLTIFCNMVQAKSRRRVILSG